MDTDDKKRIPSLPDKELAETLKPERFRPTVGMTVIIDDVPFRLRKITKKDIILRPIKPKKKGDENGSPLY